MAAFKDLFYANKEVILSIIKSQLIGKKNIDVIEQMKTIRRAIINVLHLFKRTEEEKRTEGTELEYMQKELLEKRKYLK